MASDGSEEVVGPRRAIEALGIEMRTMSRMRTGSSGNLHWVVHSRDGEVVVLRRYRWRALATVEFEVQVLRHCADHGWPTPVALSPPRQLGRHVWCVFEYRQGRRPAPRTASGWLARHREEGRMLAALQATLVGLDLGQRPPWVRRDQALEHPLVGGDVAEALAFWDRRRPVEARIVRSYVERITECFAELDAASRPTQVIHGDFYSANLRYERGTLTGVLDFDLTHRDHRVADFVWTWRARHDDVVHGFAEATPLEEAELELMVACYWASMIEWLPHDTALQESTGSCIALLVSRLRRRSALALTTRIACWPSKGG